MIDTPYFLEQLKLNGFTFFSGVPCSSLKYLINGALNSCDYYSAANEGEAVAISAGANLAGCRSGVLFQNSGLGNAVSPLTSLMDPFKLSILGFVSLRGDPETKDEPQHKLMGQITGPLLTSMGIPWAYLANSTKEAILQLDEVNKAFDHSKSFFFIVRDSIFGKVSLQHKSKAAFKLGQILELHSSVELPSRWSVLQLLVELKKKHSLLLTTTGKTGRELYEIEDAPNHFYQVGSMGCISALGLGIAKHCSQSEVIVIDGDGAMLMRMGQLATNAYYKPANMLHVVLDNNVHDSTGGQMTVSHNMDIARLAQSVGYPVSCRAHNLTDFKHFIAQWRQHRELTLLHLKIQAGSKGNLGRPKVSPEEASLRFKSYIQNIRDSLI